MIDYFTLQTGSENPAFLTVLYTLLFSFSLSMLIAVTYYKTTLKTDVSNDFIQSIILSAIVASTVVQAIGDSVAIGLGVLGALAIIRFRTNFRNPRNIIFLFAALASGIATGVYGYTIAIVGTAGFCVVAFTLDLSGLGASFKSEALLRIVFNVPKGGDEIEGLLMQYCDSYNLIAFREEPAQMPPMSKERPEGVRQQFQYRVSMKDESKKEELITKLKAMGNAESVRLEVIDNRELFEN